MKSISILLTLLFFLCSCVMSRVSSISTKPIEIGKVHVLLQNQTIESRKVQKILNQSLIKRGFIPSNYDDAKIIVIFSAGMLGSHTVSNPITRNVTDPYSGLTVAKVQGSSVDTEFRREIRIQFHDGSLFRMKSQDSILWEAVGKSSGSSSDIIRVAPGIIEGILDNLNKDVDSEKSRKFVN